VGHLNHGGPFGLEVTFVAVKVSNTPNANANFRIPTAGNAEFPDLI
jgi:hypothetical protein